MFQSVCRVIIGESVIFERAEGVGGRWDMPPKVFLRLACAAELRADRCIYHLSLTPDARSISPSQYLKCHRSYYLLLSNFSTLSLSRSLILFKVEARMSFSARVSGAVVFVSLRQFVLCLIENCCHVQFSSSVHNL